MTEFEVRDSLVFWISTHKTALYKEYQGEHDNEKRKILLKNILLLRLKEEPSYIYCLPETLLNKIDKHTKVIIENDDILNSMCRMVGCNKISQICDKEK